MTPDLVTGSSCEILKKQQGLLQSLPESQRGEIRSAFHYRPVKMGKSIFFAQSAVMQRLDGGKYEKKKKAKQKLEVKRELPRHQETQIKTQFLRLQLVLDIKSLNTCRPLTPNSFSTSSANTSHRWGGKPI